MDTTLSTTRLRLGASMYVPATRDPHNIVEIGNGQKYPDLRSVIFCTEDAVRSDEVERAVRNLRKALPQLDNETSILRFIRVRNPEILGRCLRMKGIEKIDGFVLPKITVANLQYYLAHLSDRDGFLLMPTLETKEAFDAKEMGKLLYLMEHDESARDRILCLRIGGNDLLQCLHVRRDPRRTIYDTPVGDLIKHLAGMFIPHGFGLSAPVCEVTDPRYAHVLAEELELDLLQGLFGKTVIHPLQIPLVEAAYQVDAADLEEAREILNPKAAAVFKRNGRMCEPTTHNAWAKDIVARAEIYGVRPAGPE